jgi:hypothetical protein
MNRTTKRLLAAVLASVPLLAIAGLAAASGGPPSLDPVRDATVRYHDIRVAKKQGFQELKLFGTNVSCITAGAKGAMGIHMVNSRRVADGKLKATEPEALLYEKRADGTYRFTGVEYIRPIGTERPAAGTAAPTLLGRKMSVTDAEAFFGSPTFLHTLHVWVWKPNPGGVFAAWNKQVSC